MLPFLSFPLSLHLVYVQESFVCFQEMFLAPEQRDEEVGGGDSHVEHGHKLRGSMSMLRRRTGALPA